LVAAGDTPENLSLIFCGVDNNSTRVFCADYGLRHEIPVIFTGVGNDGLGAYCFVQESKPNVACFGCAKPHALNDRTFPCNLPGIIDVLQIAAGFAAFAADTLICGRYREWNYVSLFLPGGPAPSQTLIERNPNCPLCGKQ
jgi:hypothetical protein